MNFYYHNTIGLNIIRFFKSLLNKTLVIVILSLIIGYAINLIPGFGWINFILKSVLYALVFAILMYNFGLIDFEKQLFKNTLNPIFKLINK